MSATRARPSANLKPVPDEKAIEPLYGAQSPPRPWDLAIAGLADRQHGVVARRQLLAMGLGRRAIGGRLARGNLLEVHYGVYAVGRRTLTKKGLGMAAVIAAGPGAVLSHRSAGRLWGSRRATPTAR